MSKAPRQSSYNNISDTYVLVQIHLSVSFLSIGRCELCRIFPEHDRTTIPVPQLSHISSLDRHKSVSFIK